MILQKSKLHDSLTAVDPGTHGIGISVWDLHDQCLLLAATYIPIDYKRLDRARVAVVGWLLSIGMACIERERSRLLIEQMKILLPEDGGKGNPEDLVRVSHVVGAVASLFTMVDYAEAGEWKGQKTKTVTTNISLRDLSNVELERIQYPKQKKTLGHNVDDAVAIGLAGMKALGLRKAKTVRYVAPG